VEKKNTWIEDQYHHPLERILALPWVLRLLSSLGFTWIRTVPPAPLAASLFDATDELSPMGLFARRAGWFARGLGDEDAGLVCVVDARAGLGTRDEDAPSRPEPREGLPVESIRRPIACCRATGRLDGTSWMEKSGTVLPALPGRGNRVTRSPS
jgi:hypothetical protein